MKDYYKDKTVLVTGHTGFKGSWLAIWLLEMGAKVVGYALDPLHDMDNFIVTGLSNRMVDIRGDIRDAEKLKDVFSKYQPEIVFHLAAQPLVRLSYDIPVETYQVNVIGTINIMEAIRTTNSAKIAVLITTDKCYENKEQIWGYRENDAMGGHDPYSSSKGACEIAINSWRKSYFNVNEYEQHGKSIASARAGNVIGGGDWSVDRLIPDCIKSILQDLPIEIRNPQATRPWEHVLEPLSGYLLLAYKMSQDPVKYAEGWNFGPDYDAIITVKDLAEKIINYYGKGKLALGSEKAVLHEANLLALDVSKSRIKLGWTPTLSIEQAVELTVDWYKNYQNQEPYDICVEQINKFIETES
ncbi:CDP-glucose 4,6-dehydratase [Reichenbachiella faecimaris]|uniref:CDP-glucose 4,6-dehydratase n=1 Tax=Reichenbachiella faecimaris TaxID=692418 RepID=A0A1W2GDD3_REIFA|nr:CDP-glucose 4,6-dehydratase [Reichenbachiella faecimaris]SMD34348.1 CDP-glucose 4,6-dehydratase [Reichenbachiella faecimaris]